MSSVLLNVYSLIRGRKHINVFVDRAVRANTEDVLISPVLKSPCEISCYAMKYLMMRSFVLLVMWRSVALLWLNHCRAAKIMGVRSG